MSTMWNKDGSAKVSAGTAKSGGGTQHHSIFGWADEKVQKATTETRDQSNRTWDPKSCMDANKEAAGMKTRMQEEPHHKVGDNKLKDMQGHDIFDCAPVEVIVKTDNRRVKDMQGNDIFAIANADLDKKGLSANKQKEMKGHVGIFGDDGAGARMSSPSVKVSQPAGGRSTITFG